MKKTVFRTFVCSFAISTLVIFSINKLPRYFPYKNTQSSNYQKHKNISSFVKTSFEHSASDIPSVGKDIIEEKNDLAIAELETQENIDDTLLYYSDDADDSIYSSEYDDNEAPIIAENEEAKKEEKSEEIDIAEVFSDTGALGEEPAEAVIAEKNTFDGDKKNEASQPSWQVSGLDVFSNSSGNIEEATPQTDNKKQNEQKSFIPIQKTGQSEKVENISITNNAEPNQVAMSQTDSSLKNMMTESSQAENSDTINAEDDNPWVVAKGSKFPNNNMLVSVSNSEESKAIKETFDASPKTNVGEVKVAEMVRNILIPIPEDILKEGNVTPQLISSKRNKDLQERIEQNIRDKKSEEEKASHSKQEEKNMTPISGDDNEQDSDDAKKDKKTIFDSISSIFSTKAPDIGISKNTNEQKFDTVSSVYSVKKNNKSKKDNKVTKILPTEIKLSFQPNRAEISGQTLKWIEAFANKTIEDGSVALEIRIDGTSSFELQQKRLNLLHNILTNKGVEYKKINTVFTTREPNSFIIRTVRINDKSVAVDSNPRIKEDSNYYQKW